MYTFEHLAAPEPAGGPDGDTGETTAMLLERCRPGTELRGRPEAEQHVVITDLLRSLWAVDLPADHPFRPLSVMADDWVVHAEARLAADLACLDAGRVRQWLFARWVEECLRDSSPWPALDVVFDRLDGP